MLFDLPRQRVGFFAHVDFGLRLLALRHRQPAQNEKTQHDRGGRDIGELGQDQKLGLAKQTDQSRGKETVLRAEIKTEIEILDDVARGVDRHHDQQQPRGAEYLVVTKIGDNHGREDREPYADDDPIDQRSNQAHQITPTSIEQIKDAASSLKTRISLR